MCMQQPLYCFVEGSSCTSLICVGSLYFIVLQKIVIQQPPICFPSQRPYVYVATSILYCERKQLNSLLCVCSNLYIVLQKIVVEQPPMCIQQPLYCIVEDSSSTASYVYAATFILYCIRQQLNSLLCVFSNLYIVFQKIVVQQPPMCIQQPLFCIVEDSSSTASYVYLATTILYC